MTTIHISRCGTGSRDGSSPENAAPYAALPALMRALSPPVEFIGEFGHPDSLLPGQTPGSPYCQIEGDRFDEHAHLADGSLDHERFRVSERKP